ncbi:Protein of unknown function [Pyronema omphalodes CBS 100304]|uniref:Uncharacterized protein n=1 Tax=Pyronema omphalodes (strain CBS 100304) TaxID=1076935 RepID=U4LIU3_PYROM|nr:Protein of unknown function [Pyronema omphalodes CBS 100304]
MMNVVIKSLYRAVITTSKIMKSNTWRNKL